MDSIEENHIRLVNDRSSTSKSRSRRSKSDSEIIFDSLDRQSKSQHTAARRNCCYGTLKIVKSQSGNLRKNIVEPRRSYDGRRKSKSTLKNYRNNTLPRRCLFLTTSNVDVTKENCHREKRSNSLPADIKIFSEHQHQICNLQLNFDTPPSSISNELETTNHTTTTNSTETDCDVNDHLFVFNVVLAQQQQQQDTLDMNRPRQYGRRLNSSINNSPISNNNSSSSRLSEEFHECSQITHNCEDESIENFETLDSMLVDGNMNTLEATTTNETSANRQNNSTMSSSFLHQSPRLESIIRELGPRFCQTDRNNADDGWPISISRPITCLFCCMGLFNFLRFAISTIIYGGNFLIQFVLLSLFFGVPFVLLQMVLGQRIRKGIVTLFKISPICKGIGISLIISHCILCLYTAVSIGWMMIYLR